MQENVNIACPLCGSTFQEADQLISRQQKQYRHCRSCSLISLEPTLFLAPGEEKALYDLHQNDAEEEGYRKFLEGAFQLLLKYMQPEYSVLDFGAGPTAVIQNWMQREGLSNHVFSYDPYYFPDIPKRKFPIIFASECFEHFYNPKKSIQLIDSLLEADGFLIVKSSWWHELERFPSWYYTREAAHVSFYHEKTWKWVAQHWGYTQLEADGKSLVVFQKIQNTGVVHSDKNP